MGARGKRWEAKTTKKEATYQACRRKKNPPPVWSSLQTLRYPLSLESVRSLQLNIITRPTHTPLKYRCVCFFIQAELCRAILGALAFLKGSLSANACASSRVAATKKKLPTMYLSSSSTSGPAATLLMNRASSGFAVAIWYSCRLVK